MKLELRVRDEVAVLAVEGHRDHGVVTELTSVVWVSLDNQVLDIPFAPDDSRLSRWSG